MIGSAAWHAADVNNDGIIAADDAVAVLRHIVFLDEIDTFDLIDNTTGNRISNLDANAIDVGQWSIVANGDVDQSGGFGDGYVVDPGIVAVINTAPVANPDTATTIENTTATIDVLTNDTDVDGDALSVTAATAANGIVTINSDSTLSYTGNADFNGTDTITYTVDDGTGATSTSTVSVDVAAVNNPPVAQARTIGPSSTTYTEINFINGVFELRESTGVYAGGATDGTGTLSIDFETGQGTAEFASEQLFFVGLWVAHDITIQVTSIDESTGQGTMTVSLLFDWSGSFAGSAIVDTGFQFNADDSVTFTTLDTDGDGILGEPIESGPFTGLYATIAFIGTTEPVTQTVVEIPAVIEDQNNAYEIDLSSLISDVDGDTLTLTAEATNGEIIINADGTLGYLANANFNGTEIITYTVNDGNGGIATSTITFEVAAVNDAPVANDAQTANFTSLDTDADGSIIFTLDANDSDGDLLSFDGILSDRASKLTNNDDGTMTYTPSSYLIDNNTYNYTDIITYTANDGNGGTDIGQVTFDFI